MQILSGRLPVSGDDQLKYMDTFFYIELGFFGEFGGAASKAASIVISPAL
jgi:hypothetical protein